VFPFPPSQGEKEMRRLSNKLNQSAARGTAAESKHVGGSGDVFSEGGNQACDTHAIQSAQMDINILANQRGAISKYFNKTSYKKLPKIVMVGGLFDLIDYFSIYCRYCFFSVDIVCSCLVLFGSQTEQKSTNPWISVPCAIT
jgi:hypothetical protein